MPREVERWITLGGRRIPIFKKDGIKPINKKELAKKIYRTPDDMYMLDLPKGYITVYGTDYIQYKDKASVKYDLENNVTTISANPEYQKTIKGFKRPEGNPELRIYGRDTRDNHSLHIKDDFYLDKKSAYQDTRANGYRGVRVFDKRDDYILDHTNYGGMSSIWKDYSAYKRYEKEARANGKENLADVWKKDADNLKEIIDKANKVYLQKTKRYKMKK